MSPRVVSLPKTQPVNEVVETLRDLLEMAEDGRLRDLALCGALIDGQLLTTCTSTADIHRQLAAVSVLQHRLAANIMEGT